MLYVLYTLERKKDDTNPAGIPLSFFLLPFALCGGCHLVSAVWDRVIKVTHNARQRRRGDSLVLWYCGQGILVVDRGTRKIWGKCGREETMEPTRVTDSSIGLTVSLFGVKSHGIGCAHVRVPFMVSSVVMSDPAFPRGKISLIRFIPMVCFGGNQTTAVEIAASFSLPPSRTN